MNWETDGRIRALALDGRHYAAVEYKDGEWTLYELDSPKGFAIRVIADNIGLEDVDRALQQYIGGA